MDGMLDRTYIVAAEGGEARFTWLEHRSGITREHERKREGGRGRGGGKRKTEGRSEESRPACAVANESDELTVERTRVKIGREKLTEV